jgi:hypothetical protein
MFNTLTAGSSGNFIHPPPPLTVIGLGTRISHITMPPISHKPELSETFPVRGVKWRLAPSDPVRD